MAPSGGAVTSPVWRGAPCARLAVALAAGVLSAPHPTPGTRDVSPRLSGMAESPYVSGSPSGFLDPLGPAASAGLVRSSRLRRHTSTRPHHLFLGCPGARVPIETTLPQRVTGEGEGQGRASPGSARAAEGEGRPGLPFPSLLFN